MGELTQRFKVTRASVYRWIANESFPAPVKFGRAARFEVAAVTAWEAKKIGGAQ
ncbi:MULTISPECIES: helix-turn-helix transcriptional regulator [Deefgea]